MLRILLLLVVLPILSMGQSFHEWKPLPEVTPTQATVVKKPVKVMNRLPKEKPYFIKKTYTGDAYQFQKLLQPVDFQPIEFRAQSLTWDELQYIPTGLIFKDLSRGNIKYLDKAHGLFSNEVYAITEDSLGRIYFGTNEGLGIFNGEEMKIYRGTDNFPFSDIRDLKFDKQGRLWIARSEGFAYMHGDSLYLPNQLSNIEIFRFSITDDDNLVINTTNRGLIILKDDQYKIIDQFKTSFICDYHEDNKGRAWVALERYGISFIRNDSIFNIPRVDHINTARVFFENDSALWIGTFAGKVHFFADDSLFSIDLTDSFEEYNTYSIEEANGKLWFGAYGPAVFSIDPSGIVKNYTTSDGLTGDFTYDIHIDYYGNVWISDLQDGVSRIDENIFYQSNLAVSDLSYSEIEKDSLGYRWFFPAGTYLTRETEDAYIQYSNETGGIFRLTTYAEQGLIRGNEVWMSNYGMGITVFTENGYIFYLNGEDFFTNSVFYLEEDKSGNLWMVTLDNKLVKFKDGTFSNYSSSEPFSEFEFSRISKTSGEAIVAYTEKNGLFVIWGDSYWHLNKNNGLSTDQVSFAYQDKAGVIWIFQDGVVDLVEKDDVRQFVTPALKNNAIRNVEELPTGELLALSYEGLMMISLKENELDIQLLDEAYGINLPDNENLYYDGSKYLVLGHGKIFNFDATNFRDNSLKPKLSVDRVEVNNRWFSDGNQSFQIEQSVPIQFSYNMISWGRPTKLNYRFTRNNQPDQWVKQNSGAINLNELDRGNYQLEAYIDDGITKSAVHRIEFRVLPFWYETWWALLTYTSLIILLGIAIIYFRGVRSKQKREILQKLVNKKTQELQAEKQQVTKQLKEKEVLLKEVNHRVKNNLQIISSLLQMQVGKLENEELSHILLETHSRVRSMSLIHQKLYESNDVSSIVLKEYASQLIEFIQSSFGSKKASVDIEISGDEIHLDIEKAVPLGLIINELATNAFKYGSNKKGSDKIELTFSKLNENEMAFTFADNGIGLPTDFDWSRSKSLGIRLVNILTRQIDGELFVANKKGAFFKITFPMH